MELTILNAQELAALPLVKWNLDELKSYAATKAEEYKSIAYTEDDVQAMKADRADINRFIKAIEAERIQKKKEYMQPYTVFENQVKEVLQPLQEAEKLIAKGLKEIDDKWKQERTEKIRKIYEDNIGDLSGVLPFETVLTQDMLKKSITLTNIKESFVKFFDRVKGDLEEIGQLPEQYQAVALRAYKTNGRELSLALGEARQAQKDAEEMEERRRRAAEQEAKAREIREAFRAAEDQKAAAKEPAVQEPVNDASKEADHPGAQDTEPILQLNFRVYGTREQILALRDYMKAVSLKFERVE